MTPNVRTREVRFKLSDAKAYDEKALAAAFADVGFPVATVSHRPEVLAKTP